MTVLTNKEQELTGDLIRRGYEKAATSMSSLVSQEVRVREAMVQIADTSDEVVELLNGGDYHTVLVTELMGDIKGESYLVFTENERKKICELCTKVFGGPGAMPEEAVLQELDNIVSASMITEFSNALKLSIFGNVPKLIKKEDFDHSFLNADKDGYFIVAEGGFIMPEDLELRPKFIWRLEEKLISRLVEG